MDTNMSLSRLLSRRLCLKVRALFVGSQLMCIHIPALHRSLDCIVGVLREGAFMDAATALRAMGDVDGLRREGSRERKNRGARGSAYHTIRPVLAPPKKLTRPIQALRRWLRLMQSSTPSTTPTTSPRFPVPSANWTSTWRLRVHSTA